VVWPAHQMIYDMYTPWFQDLVEGENTWFPLHVPTSLKDEWWIARKSST
jgi:hypothetical protein